MRITKQVKNGRKPVGYYVNGERVSNFTFKILDLRFEGQKHLISIQNSTTERFLSIKPLVSFSFKKFEITCLNHGNFCFGKDLSTLEFNLLFENEVQLYLKK